MNVAEKLHEVLEGSKLQGEQVLLPDWGITVTPHIFDLKDTTVGIGFEVSSPHWDRELSERTVGFGDSQETAVGSALGNFIFGMLDGLKPMMKGLGYSCGGCTCEDFKEELTTEFAGKTHNWSMYKSNILGMGIKGSDTKKDNIISNIWDGIRDEVIKRLGNQKLCYVKVFISNSGGDVTCECRINDAQSFEITELMHKYCTNWKVENFALQKMFVYFLQNEDSYIPYPYTEKDIANHVKRAIALIEEKEALETMEEYAELIDILGDEINDNDLAREIFVFLPVICAERAFKTAPTESVGIVIGELPEGEEPQWVYKSQIASFFPILWTTYEGLGNGIMTPDTYKKLAMMSSICATLNQIAEAGHDMSDISRFDITSIFFMAEDYSLR